MKRHLVFLIVSCLVFLISLPVGRAFWHGSTTSNNSVLLGLPGLQLLLDSRQGCFSDTGVTPCVNSGKVAQWNDQSVNAKNATQGTSGQQPSYSSNTDLFPAISCSGSRMLVGSNADFAAQTFTAFAAFDSIDSNFTEVLMNKGDATSAANSTWEMMASESSALHRQLDTFVGASNHTGPTYVGNFNWELTSAERLSATSKNIYQNGVLQASGSDSGGSLNAGAAILGICNGGLSGVSGNLPFVGYLRLLAYYSPALSPTDRQAAENYIMGQFNIGNPTFNVTTCAIDATVTPYAAQIYSTTDGLTWSAAAGVTNPVFTIPSSGGTGTTSSSFGCNLFFSSGKNTYYMAYEINDFSGTQKSFGIASAAALNGPWTWLTDVTPIPGCSSGCFVWNPHWFVDDDNSVHIYFLTNQNTGAGGAFTPMIVDAQNSALTSWSAATQLTGTALPAQCGDPYLISPGNSPLGVYTFWTRNFGSGFIEQYAGNASSRTSGYNTAVHTGNWLGVGTGWEGDTIMHISGSHWRLYAYPTAQGGGWAFLDNFDNWANWQNRFKATSLLFTKLITTGPITQGP